MAEGKIKAPAVDGKRLAQLEASVSSLALALSSNGFVFAPGADPCVVAIASIKDVAKLRDGALQVEQLANYLLANSPDAIDGSGGACETAIKVIEAHRARVAELEELVTAPPSAEEVNDGALEQLRKRVAELELENAELQHDVEDLANARNALANRLSDEGKSANEPAPIVIQEEPEPAPLVRPELARDVGPTFGKLSIDELKILATENAPLEVVFSNGEFEILAFSTPAILINGSDLQLLDGYRHVITPAIHIKGGTMPERIAGVGLMLGEVQVAYHAFTAPLEIQPGAEWKFERQIAF